MAKICHAHCPDHSGAFLAALAAVLALALAVIVGQVVESLFVAIMVTGSVLIAAGCALFAYLLYRDRARPAASPASQHALTGRVMQAIPAPAARAIPAPRRSAAALPAVVTDRRTAAIRPEHDG